ncbi:failed axon connections homolog [Babylonia areolata]|uniref:failed axon connections homolog n=1 Tax=Babylonia areolata TaxID=304850 RepID=UPI003FD2ED62
MSQLTQLTPYLDELKTFYNNHTTLCRGIIASLVGVRVLKWLRAGVKKRQNDKKRKEYPQDTVILHHIGRGPYAPSLVPFAVKLETYLRMANIPYKCEHGYEKSSKHKYPWITYNGEDLADSSFIIHFLNQHLKVNLNSWMTDEQRAVATAFQRLVEDDLYWILVVTRWVNELNADFIRLVMGFPLAMFFVRTFMTRHVRTMCWAQGMGRHSQQDVQQIARKDLTALSNYLGKKKFLMGDKACEEDCAVFGQLSQIYWQMPSSINTIFKDEFPQLVAYCERMKDTYWPDWKECTTQGGTAEATR